MNPNPWAQKNLEVLAAGLTESRLGRSPLPYVAEEIENIKIAVRRTAVLLNQEFTRTSLPSRMLSSPAPTVHIATHGQFSATPEDTYLLTWDQIINVREINRMLQANLGERPPIELLVLSACETASGSPESALGLAGVAIKAGARSTLATLWSINDEVTAVFAKHFYKYLAQPEATRAGALRAAQLEMMAEPNYRHPIYWAPYVLIGSWL